MHTLHIDVIRIRMYISFETNIQKAVSFSKYITAVWGCTQLKGVNYFEWYVIL